jgi:hypothetical protein
LLTNGVLPALWVYLRAFRLGNNNLFLAASCGKASLPRPERINENSLVLSGVHPEKPHSCIHALGMRELGLRMESAYYPEVFQSVVGLRVRPDF